LLEIIIGRLPFLQENEKDLDHMGLYYRIKNSNFERDIENLRPKYSNYLCEFLSKCLQEHEKRPKIDELQETLFYKNNVESCTELNIAKMLEEHGVTYLKKFYNIFL
jgi:hypothetical protein